MLDKLEIGVISSTHGLKGEVNIYPTTDEPERFRELKKVLLELPSGEKEVGIERVTFFKGKPIIKLEGYDSIEDVKNMKGISLMVRREDALPLREGQYYIGDLLGSRVLLDNGENFGLLEDILRTGANDVYAVKKTDGAMSYIPAIDDYVVSVDAVGQTIVVRPMREI